MNYFEEINLENIYPYFSSTPFIVAALYLRPMPNITMRLTFNKYITAYYNIRSGNFTLYL
jgi:hypothetical protein